VKYAWNIALAIIALISSNGANAKTAGKTYVFFRNKPAQLPEGLVALKVRAPSHIDTGAVFLDVTILEPTDGVRGFRKLNVKVDEPGVEWCDSACGNDRSNLGVVDGPAYIFGAFEQGSGPVFFHAVRLHGSAPALRDGKRPEDFVVDPVVRTKMKLMK
jgi:hypothetical protein